MAICMKTLACYAFVLLISSFVFVNKAWHLDEKHRHAIKIGKISNELQNEGQKSSGPSCRGAGHSTPPPGLSPKWIKNEGQKRSGPSRGGAAHSAHPPPGATPRWIKNEGQKASGESRGGAGHRAPPPSPPLRWIKNEGQKASGASRGGATHRAPSPPPTGLIKKSGRVLVTNT
ncbi:hypothetical protein Salat_1185300 [Sesamum alatum]|uniref:Uncharacterized protein n=1 Tax=Sesamum alatum TaxID=300844 RepID=A0AAE2CNZ3_9LAMI|nr:hypothetical protein Salat_1185300 [Sesamum alatum]